jgi:hypothetical protein
MGKITIVNNTSVIVYVSVTKIGGGGSDGWYPLQPKGQDVWVREVNQVISYVPS